MRANFGPETGDFTSERVDMGLLGLISGLKEPDLGLRGLGGGCMDGRMDVWTDGWKIFPFYRTSSPIGAAALLAP